MMDRAGLALYLGPYGRAVLGAPQAHGRALGWWNRLGHQCIYLGDLPRGIDEQSSDAYKVVWG